MLETTLRSGDTEERCGFLLKDGTVVELDNIAANPVTSYEMNPEQALPYLEADTVAATWHTHPDSDPTLSEEDRAGFVGWPDLGHIIIGRRDGGIAIARYRVEDGLVIVCS